MSQLFHSADRKPLRGRSSRHPQHSIFHSHFQSPPLSYESFLSLMRQIYCSRPDECWQSESLAGTIQTKNVTTPISPISAETNIDQPSAGLSH